MGNRQDKKREKRGSKVEAVLVDDEVATARPTKVGDSEAQDQNTVFTGPVLKQIRESQGVSLKKISERTKINQHILAALEEERFQDVPNARVYVRGFVRCLAREIGLDQDNVSRTYVPRWEQWFEQHEAP